MNLIERVYALDRVLRKQKQPLARQQLKQQVQQILGAEISWATFKRDIKYLRDHLRAPIVFSRREPRGYIYDQTQPAFELPGFWFNADELRALLVCSEVFKNLEPGILSETIVPLRQVIEKLLSSGGALAEQVTEHVEVRLANARKVDAAVFRAVVTALLKQWVLQFNYHSRSKNQNKFRKVDPQRLIFYKSNWYLLAIDRTKRQWRLFALDRMSNPVIATTKAKAVSTKTIDKRISVGFGIFLVEHARQATLRFSARRARWVADEIWHPDQQDQLLPDGRLERTLPYGESVELLMEIMRHGGEVEVIKPKSLRQSVLRQHQRAIQKMQAR